MEKRLLNQVGSESELNAATQAAYWLDGATVQLKLFTNQNISVLLERQ